MNFISRIKFAFGFSLPALLVTIWFVADAYSNDIGLIYGGVIFLVMIVIPVWLGMLYLEIQYRRNRYHQMPAIPILSIVYPLLYIAFFFVVGYCQERVGKLNLVNANGYASSVGLVIGAWTWYGLVFLSFVLLCLLRGPKQIPRNPAEQVADGKTPGTPKSSR